MQFISKIVSDKIVCRKLVAVEQNNKFRDILANVHRVKNKTQIPSKATKTC